MQKRAQAGGQIGANGEWYEGGKFIATTDHAKGKPVEVTLQIGKEQYEPYKWAVAPVAGQRPIFAMLNSFATLNRQTMKIARMQRPVYNMVWGYSIDELIELWNRGERWIDVAW